MALIYIHQRSKKSPKKPGWKQAEADYQAWLARVSSEKTNFSAKNRGPVKKVAPTKSEAVTTTPERKPVDLDAFRGATKPVHRPELVYRDDPELLARELKARERKFNVAPAFNKGGDVFVTEEQLIAQLSSNKRRS